MILPENYITSFSLATPIKEILDKNPNVSNFEFTQNKNLITFLYHTPSEIKRMQLFINRHFKTKKHTLSLKQKVCDNFNVDIDIVDISTNSGTPVVFYSDNHSLVGSTLIEFNKETLESDLNNALKNLISNVYVVNNDLDIVLKCNAAK